MVRGRVVGRDGLLLVGQALGALMSEHIPALLALALLGACLVSDVVAWVVGE